jgi:hypothetical protein
MFKIVSRVLQVIFGSLAPRVPIAPAAGEGTQM